MLLLLENLLNFDIMSENYGKERIRKKFAFFRTKISIESDFDYIIWLRTYYIKERWVEGGSNRILADLLETDKDQLLNLWLAEQIYSVVKDEENAEKVLDIVHESVIEYKSGFKK